MNRGYRVSPLKITMIRDIAQQLRDTMPSDETIFPIVKFLERLQAKELIQLEILDDVELPDCYGISFPDVKKIFLRQSIYDNALLNDGFSRLTIAHELGHLVLHKQEIGFAKGLEGSTHKIIEDSEWQANKFAQELLVDVRLLPYKPTRMALEKLFAISAEASDVAFNSLKREGIL